jgi:hypothetical protein
MPSMRAVSAVILFSLAATIAAQIAGTFNFFHVTQFSQSVQSAILSAQNIAKSVAREYART